VLMRVPTDAMIDRDRVAARAHRSVDKLGLGFSKTWTLPTPQLERWTRAMQGAEPMAANSASDVAVFSPNTLSESSSSTLFW